MTFPSRGGIVSYIKRLDVFIDLSLLDLLQRGRIKMARQSKIPELIEAWERDQKPNFFLFNNTTLFKNFKDWCVMKQISPPSYPSFNNIVKEIKEDKKETVSDKGICVSKEPKISTKESLAQKEVNIQVNVDLLANGHTNGFILSGPTGIGKTTAVLSRLEECNLEYLYHTGSISNSLEFYKFLHEHRENEIILIDDTKKVIGSNDVCADIVSAALDDNHLKKNEISYLHKDLKSPAYIEALEEEIEELEDLVEEAKEEEKEAKEDERRAKKREKKAEETGDDDALLKAIAKIEEAKDKRIDAGRKKNKAITKINKLMAKKAKTVPNRFHITSGIIFLTNTSMDKIDKAIGSRCFPLDYWLDKDEILLKIQKSINDIFPDNAMSHKKEVLKMFREEKNSMKRFDIRSYKKACVYRFANKELMERGTDWKTMTRNLVNSGT